MKKMRSKPKKYQTYDILALLSGLDSFPNCDVVEISKKFSKALGGVPSNLLPSVVAQIFSNYSIQHAAWDLRDWLFKNPEPTTTAKRVIWKKVTFPSEVRNVLRRYNIPDKLTL